MNRKIIYGIIIVIMIAVLVTVFWRGEIKLPIKTSATFPYSSIKETPSETMFSPMQSTLTLMEKPLLEKPVTLILSFKSVSPAPNTKAKIELPNGFELVSGTPTWNGDLEANKEQKIEVTIKSKKVGYYRLAGSAVSVQVQGESYFGDTAAIDIEITPNDAIAGSKPENNWFEPSQMQGIPVAVNNQQIQSELLISPAPELDKEFTIIYKLTPSINIPDPQRTWMTLAFPPKAFKIIAVQFPEGGETYQQKAQLTWKGSIDKGQTIEIKATLKVINTGWGSVYGSLDFQPSGEIANSIYDVKIADLYVDKYGGTFTPK